jgi:glycosyltransferase involved in cell wall biosynthesis
MCKVSVIVPVFNTASYLECCINSILGQSFSDFELLLVDDGSTDDSGAICDEYAKKDKRIRVFHKENGGVSSARNLGLDNAKGEWVYFVDSDDEVLPDGFQTMMDGISEDVDVVMAGFEKINENGLMIETIDESGETVILSKKESLSSLYHRYALGYVYLGWMWLRMFRNEVIQRDRIRFDTNLAIKEDTLFETQYICRSNGVTRFVKKPVYRYFMRQNGAMSGWRHGFDYKYVDSFYALVKMKHVIQSASVFDSELSYVAKDGLWRRYVEIKNGLKESGRVDNELTKTLRHDLFKEGVGLYFFILKAGEKIKKRCRLLT